ncbi:MAG: hypothetical protein KY476_12435 [Planctomycetes bacterium]|nr:hypothetical protein [Planctomycetota bacterium]
MTFHGHVENGVVVVDDSVQLPEGAAVRIEVVEAEPAAETVETTEPLSEILLRYAGKAVGLPSDMARNHDHYLYGTPKR